MLGKDVDDSLQGVIMTLFCELHSRLECCSHMERDIHFHPKDSGSS